MSLTIKIIDQEGKELGTKDVSFINYPFNKDMVAKACKYFMSIRKVAVSHTKSRGEVRGGGRKPWRQKHMGKARFGSTRNPVWRKGGIAHGPKSVKNFTISINKLEKILSLRSAISKYCTNGQVVMLDKWETVSTKKFASLKEKIFPNKPLLVVYDQEKDIFLSARNESRTSVSAIDSLNTLDVMSSSNLLITTSAIEKLSNKLN